MKNRKSISIFDEIIVDNFAGGGGASTGIELALGRPIDIAINHDPDQMLSKCTKKITHIQNIYVNPYGM